ncbi:MAG TPA: FAD-binding protein [Actinomycetes bacterium]
MLRADLACRLVTPDDDGWEAVRSARLLTVDQQPAAVVEVAGVADVQAVLRFAAAHDLTVAAQPGGHGASRALDGAILVRTGALDELTVDPAAQVARVGAGVKRGRPLDALDGSGLVGLVGSNPDVSVVGFLLGGGLSWFGRRHGLAAHCLRAVELVDATGVHRRVTDESDPDLMWALRGGGGDFGVVTAVEIDLHPAPEIYGGKLMFPIEDARPVLRAFAATSRQAPDELTLWASLMHFPPAPFLPEPIRGKSFATVDAMFLGAVEPAEALLAPIRAAGTVLQDTTSVLSAGQLGGVAQEPTDPTPGLDASALMPGFDDAVIDRILELAGDASRTPVMGVQVRHLGGALARDVSGNAVAHRIEHEYLLFALGIAPAVPAVAAGLAEVRAGLAAYTVDQTAFTFLSAHEGAERAYAPDRLQKLQPVKRAVDPDTRIRGNHPVLGS